MVRMFQVIFTFILWAINFPMPEHFSCWLFQMKKKKREHKNLENTAKLNLFHFYGAQ